MKKILLILCLLAFTNAVYAEANYNRTSSPLSVGQTDKYFRDLNSWDSSNLYVPGQPYNYNPQVYGQTGPNTNTQPNGHYVYTTTETTTGQTTNNTTPQKYYNQGMNINSPNYQGTAQDTNTSVKTTGAANVQQAPKRRWNKNASENHYNFGGTGFKSSGFNQGYGQ